MAGTSLITSIGDNKLYTDSHVTKEDTNYIGTESGAANALTANLTDINGGAISLAAGLRILLKTANTLQAGANTLALNGGATKSIVTTGLRDLKTIVVAGAILDLVYDGTQWQMLNSDTMIS